MAQMSDAQVVALRDQLLKQLSARATEVARLECYRGGDHPMPQGLTEASGRKGRELRRTFRRLLDESRSNWCGLVVDAVDERLAVDGFRFKDDPEVARDVWELWQANAMDAESLLLHGSALTTGQAFVLVWPGMEGAPPSVTVEHASEVLVAYEAGSTRMRRAAIKQWTGEDGHRYCNLYLPEAVYKWETERKVSGFAGQFYAQNPWVRRTVVGEDWPLRNPFGVVPVVEYRANPRLMPAPYGGGCSEFEGVLSIQDRVNETVFGRLLAMHFSAFRQKWGTGLEIPKDPDTGEALEPFDAAVSKLWATPGKEVRFGEFSEHNLRNYLEAAEADVQHLAAITKTPPHYLLGRIENISGDALKAAESGLIAKVRRHQRFLGEAHEEVARLMVAAKDPTDPRAKDVTCEVVWRDPETRTEAERVDALVKLRSLGVPILALWERIPGVTQTELARWQQLAGEEAALQALATITTQVPQEPAAPAPTGGG